MYVSYLRTGISPYVILRRILLQYYMMVAIVRMSSRQNGLLWIFNFTSHTLQNDENIPSNKRDDARNIHTPWKHLLHTYTSIRRMELLNHRGYKEARLKITPHS